MPMLLKLWARLGARAVISACLAPARHQVRAPRTPAVPVCYSPMPMQPEVAHAPPIRGGDGGRRHVRLMEDLMDKPPPPRPKPAKLTARQEREAAALRANLRKRKDQARAREKPKQE